MSVSSGGSFCGEDDLPLLPEDEEVDFYSVLNVAKDATIDEINKAYRKRCLIFHPDRHIDDEDKQTAERIFVQLRRAHETLSDPKKRAIYDALGVQGLEAQGWELVSMSANPENIRREYEFLQRLREQELMMQRTHPTSSFVVKGSCAGLFLKDEEDRYAPQLLGLAVTQAVDSAFTSTDRVGLVGRIKAGNGQGDGNMSLIWKKSLKGYTVDSTLTGSADSVSLSCRGSCSVFQRAAIIVQPQLQYNYLQDILTPSVNLVYSMRLRLQWQGSVVLALSPVNSAITTTLVHTEKNLPKVVTNLTLSPVGSNVRVVYYMREPERDAVTECACQLSVFGISPSILMERRLSRFSRIGCALSFSFPSCNLTAKFKLKSGQHSYEFQLVLCDDREALSRAFIYGVAVPYCTYSIAKVLFQPLFEKVNTFFDDQSVEKQVDVAKQEESSRVINLMRPTAERIRKEEESKQGIVILEAKYGQCDPSGSVAYPMPGERTIDVTVPLQSMVHDSMLRIYSVKSQLPGFYDPCPGDAKMLHIRYVFRGEPHACTVADEMPIQIPLKAHRLS